ncbi:MAG: hypothetical protein LKG11_05305 [Bacilli bacterium]|nr:hypothetical protein [Bacilli bacterium]
MAIALMSLVTEKDSLKLAGADAAKTFTINGSTPVDDNYVVDQTEGYAEYDQIVSGNEGTRIHIINDYTGTDYQTVEFNNPAYYFRGTAPTLTVAEAQMNASFGVKGLTSLSYEVTLGIPYEYGGSFRMSVYDSANNELLASTESGSQTLSVAEGAGTSALIKFYFYGYESYTLTSVTFNYNCVGV